MAGHGLLNQCGKVLRGLGPETAHGKQVVGVAGSQCVQKVRVKKIYLLGRVIHWKPCLWIVSVVQKGDEGIVESHDRVLDHVVAPHARLPPEGAPRHGRPNRIDYIGQYLEYTPGILSRKRQIGLYRGYAVRIRGGFYGASGKQLVCHVRDSSGHEVVFQVQLQVGPMREEPMQAFVHIAVEKPQGHAGLFTRSGQRQIVKRPLHLRVYELDILPKAGGGKHLVQRVVGPRHAAAPRHGLYRPTDICRVGAGDENGASYELFHIPQLFYGLLPIPYV